MASLDMHNYMCFYKHVCTKDDMFTVGLMFSQICVPTLFIFIKKYFCVLAAMYMHCSNISTPCRGITNYYTVMAFSVMAFSVMVFSVL